MELVVFLVSLFGFLALGIPIAIVLVLCSMVLMYYGGMWDSMFVMIIPQSMLDGANNYPLMAIPFFVFAGEIMTEGGLSKRVVKLAQLIIGRVRGGLGYAAIVSSVIFAGLMGSSVGEAAALGSLLLPMMAQAGYKPGRAGGVIASGAILGPIIPPSTNFILLGATVGLSITKLFMIGLVPGLIIGLCLMVTWFFIVRIDGYKEKIEFKKGEASKIVRDAMPAFMMPVLLLGGIRFGVFTPTEGGAFACVYAIAVCTLYYRELTFKGLLAVSARAARTTSVVMLIVGCSLAQMRFKQISGSWWIYALSALKLAAVPLLAYAVLRHVLTNEFALCVLTVLLCMPIATNTTILSYQYGADETAASSGVFVSTLLSLLTIPLMMKLLFGT